jgi:hypothetical protein
MVRTGNMQGFPLRGVVLFDSIDQLGHIVEVFFELQEFNKDRV